jgi:ATP-binding cassette, subfamily F, member 3
VLSGGEKARVALAKTIVSKANFLLLDEPTNHLDIHSVDLLVEALNKYEGTIVLVSHDRYFISRLANKIWEIDDLKIREFKGTYKEWEEWKQRREAEKKKESSKPSGPADTQTAVAAVKETPAVNKPAVNKEQRGTIDKELKKELQKQKNRFQQIEEKIAQLNKTKAKLESDLASPAIYGDKNKFRETESAYKQNTDDLQKANAEYEIVFEKLMELEEKAGQ